MKLILPEGKPLMKKRNTLFLLLSLTFLAACQSRGTPQVTPTRESKPLPSATPLPSPTQPPPTEVPTLPPQEASTSETMPGCTVMGKLIEPDPTVETLFPAVSKEDWVMGRNDAAATIVEYGDFQ